MSATPVFYLQQQLFPNLSSKIDPPTHTHTLLFLLPLCSFIPIFVLFHHSSCNDLYPYPITIKPLKTSRIPAPLLFRASFTHRFILIKTGSQNVGTNRQSNILPRFYLHAENQCSTEIVLQNECKKRRYSWLRQTKKKRCLSHLLHHHYSPSFLLSFFSLKKNSS